MQVQNNKKVIVTGASGLLGSAIKRQLNNDNSHEFLSSRDCNLLNINSVRRCFEDGIENEYNTIIHCAAKVGGVKANMDNNELFFNENLEINNNLLEVAYRAKYKNFVSILSTCVFPDKIDYPLTADKIDQGPPHNSNYGYSYAKRLLGYQTKIYGKMIPDSNWISIIPTNIYGPNDNFNLEDSHLVPALIRKGYEASLSGKDFEVWGDGTPLRQFIYSEDLAKVILWAIDNWKSDMPFMAVNETEHSIKEIVDIIARRFNISEDRIKYDITKPKGQFRKPAKSDIPKEFVFTPLEDGINKTIDWFIENYKTARK
jgi:GDP-L-fucose synthase